MADVKLERSDLTGGFADSVNSIVVSGDFVFINGHLTSGGSDRIRRINHKKGEITHTYSYSGSGLGQARDGMDQSATDIWFAAGGHLIQLLKSDLSLINDYTIDATGGVIQFVVFDVTESVVWVFLKGGTSGDADSVLRINAGTGVIDATIDPTDGATYPTINRKSATLTTFDNYLYLCSSASSKRWFRIERTTNAFTVSADAGGDYENAITADDVTIWTGGDDGVLYDPTPYFAGTAASFLSTAQIGIAYELHYDGTRVWVLRGPASDTAQRSHVIEISRVFAYSVGLDANVPGVEVGRVAEIALNPSAVLLVPNDLTSDANFLYACHLQDTTGVGDSKTNVTKLRRT